MISLTGWERGRVYAYRHISDTQSKATIHCNIQHNMGQAKVNTVYHHFLIGLKIIYYSCFLTVCSPRYKHTLKHTHLSLSFSPSSYSAFSCMIFSNHIFPFTALLFFFGLSGKGAKKWVSIRHHPICLHYIMSPSGCPRLSLENKTWRFGQQGKCFHQWHKDRMGY